MHEKVLKPLLDTCKSKLKDWKAKNKKVKEKFAHAILKQNTLINRCKLIKQEKASTEKVPKAYNTAKDKTHNKTCK